MNNYVIDLAKTHALSEFAALIRCVMSDAGRGLTQSLSNAAGEQRTLLMAARQVLDDEGDIVCKRLNAVFAGHLERAMQTMYTDLRPSLDSVSIDSLSLIDDDTVNRQIEVDRVATRLRDADPQSLGRLNIMVAQLHGEHEVRERENPFRPYLIARVLHQVTQDASARPAVKMVLFERLADAAVANLPGYYSAIRAIFESSGVEARLQAVPSRFDFTQRGMLRDTAVFHLPGRGQSAQNTAAPAAGDMRQLLAAMRGTNTETGPASRLQAALRALPAAAPNLQAAPSAGTPESDFPLLLEPDTADAGVSGQILSRLDTCLQRATQDGNPGDGGDGSGAAASACPARCRLATVREQLLDSDSGELATAIVDLTAALFDWIADDKRLAPAMRCRIAQLQLPFAKAALTAPDLLLNASHPARMLVNRLGSAAFGLDAETLPGRRIVAETARIVSGLLQDASHTEDIAGAFAARLDEFDRFLSATLVGDAAQTIEAIRDTLGRHRRLAYAASSLRALLAPIPLESPISVFIIQAWSRLLTASMDDANGGAARRGEYASLLAALVWSLHEKSAPEEKSTLLRILPNLVKRIRIALESISFPEQELQEAMDLLVAAHKNVLYATPAGDAAPPGLDVLQRRFAVLADMPDKAVGAAVLPPDVDAAAVAQSLGVHGAAIDLHLQGAALPAPPDSFSRLQPGVAVESVVAEASPKQHPDAAPVASPLRLIWIDAARSVMLFGRLDRFASAGSALYSAAAAQRALRDGTLRIAEQAPLFERAVDSLMRVSSRA